MINSIPFFTIFILIVIAFASLMKDFFQIYNQKYFGNLFVSIRSILHFSYGIFHFDGYSKLETLGSVITIIFGVISVVMMLN